MSQTEIVVIAALVAAGVALVGLLLMRGEGSTETKPEVPAEEPRASSTHDPVQRLSETLQALRKLSELRDEVTGTAPPARAAAPVRPAPVPTPATPAGLSDTDNAARDLRILVAEAFSPSAPVSRRDLFAGRTQQMEDLIDTVYERGQHAVIYGERGVGKTSIATVMSSVFDGHETQLGLRVNCDSSDTYGSLWKKVFEQLRELTPAHFDPVDGGAARSIIDLTAETDDIHPNDVRRVFAELAATKECVIFIDEFDTLRDPTASRLFADTIKMLSDQLVPATIVLVGVADDLDELIEEHGSVRRALVQIHMPRMSNEELGEIVEQGLELLSMKCEPDALDHITYLAQGVPHYTHLLAQAAARAAIDADRPSVEIEDVRQAMTRVVERVHQSIREAYDQAISSNQPALYEAVLTAAALAPRDERGYFSASAIRKPLMRIAGREQEGKSYLRHLNAMCDPQRGSALQRKGTDRRVMYRFNDPLLQPYAVMKALLSNTINGKVLAEFSAN